jgi:hypothetical protein
MLLVLLFAAALIVLGLPALQQMIHRSRIEGATRECAVLCQRSRLEAIKEGFPVVVRFDTTDHAIVSWVDENADGVQDEGERELVFVPLPGTVELAGPPSTQPIEGFTVDSDGGWVMFFTDGSIDQEGWVHFGDQRSNYLRLTLRPRATGAVTITKWDPVKSEWFPQREGQPWEWY